MTGPRRPAGSVSLIDIAADSLRTVRSRLGRSIGVGVAAALGVATLVGAVQLAASADAQVQRRIMDERPEVLRAQPVLAEIDLLDQIPDGDLQRASNLDGVRAVSVVQRLAYPSSVRIGPHPTQDLYVAGIAGDLPTSSRIKLEGRSFTDGELRAGAHVALVGRRAATALALGDIEYHPIIWVRGSAYTVIGIIDDSELAPDLVDQIAIPRQTLVAELSSKPGDFSSVMYVRAEKDAVPGLATDLAMWLRPDKPENWRVEVPRTSLDLAASISGDVRTLSLAFGGLVLLIGAVGIGNAMLRSVYTRLQEIGLRRALGARTGHISWLLIIEAVAIGVIAGAIGTVLGFLAAILVAAANGWPMAPTVWLPAAGVGLAVAAALVGAATPIRVATRVTPAEALRRE